jgi:hypothetical protein
MRQQQLVSFEVKHVTQMQLSASSSGIIGMVKPEHFKALEQLPYNYTLLVEGKPIACGGVIRFWDTRGEVWSLLDEQSGHRFILWHRCVQRFLASIPVKRMEAVVEKSFEPGHRWVKMLGFKVDAPFLQNYFPNGADGVLYSKIQRGGKPS